MCIRDRDYHAKFRQNRSIGQGDIAIFLFFKMAAVRHFGFSNLENFKGWLAEEVPDASPCPISSKSIKKNFKAGMPVCASSSTKLSCSRTALNRWISTDNRCNKKLPSRIIVSTIIARLKLGQNFIATDSTYLSHWLSFYIPLETKWIILEIFLQPISGFGTETKLPQVRFFSPLSSGTGLIIVVKYRIEFNKNWTLQYLIM